MQADGLSAAPLFWYSAFFLAETVEVFERQDTTQFTRPGLIILEDAALPV